MLTNFVYRNTPRRRLPVAGATKEQFRLMMQNLLAERLHLKIHMESKEFPA
jgi:uncharacterized protein (TIGR03435 family)